MSENEGHHGPSGRERATEPRAPDGSEDHAPGAPEHSADGDGRGGRGERGEGGPGRGGRLSREELK